MKRKPEDLLDVRCAFEGNEEGVYSICCGKTAAQAFACVVFIYLLMNLDEKHNTISYRGCLRRFALVMLLLCALLLIMLTVNLMMGSVGMSASKVLSLIGERLFSSSRGASELGDATILFSIRMPRMLLACLLGGALSVSGFLLQSFFRNPIAGPFVLGISSGAKMIVGITMIFLAKKLILSPGALIAAAFIGSLLVTALVLLFSQKVRSMELLLVVGIMVGYICSAVTDVAITFASEQDIVNLKYWSMGSFSGKGWEQVKAAALVCIPTVTASFLLSKPMGAYALGEGYARSMGVRLKPFRLALILLSSLLSACVTAIAGPISFVGIAVPHITRTLLKSSRPALVIPASFLAGAVFCLGCDLIARTVFAPTELNISTVTSVFGAPVVILMMLSRRRGAEG